MAITSMSGLIAAMAGAVTSDAQYKSITGFGSNFLSLWTAGSQPGPGATPATGAGAAPTSSTAGAFYLPSISGSNTLYILKAVASTQQSGYAMIYDRLVHTSGLVYSTTSAQTVNSTAISRSYNSNVNVGCWLENYSTAANGALTMNMSYTNQSGTSGRAGSCSVPASVTAGLAIPFSLQSGDTGVQSVQSVTSGTASTGGNFGITLVERLVNVPMNNFASGPTTLDSGQILDWAACSMPQVLGSACLAVMVPNFSATGGAFDIELTLGQG